MNNDAIFIMKYSVRTTIYVDVIISKDDNLNNDDNFYS